MALRDEKGMKYTEQATKSSDVGESAPCDLPRTGCHLPDARVCSMLSPPCRQCVALFLRSGQALACVRDYGALIALGNIPGTLLTPTYYLGQGCGEWECAIVPPSMSDRGIHRNGIFAIGRACPENLLLFLLR